MNSKTPQKSSKGNTETFEENFYKRDYCFTSFEKTPPVFDEKKIRYLCFSPEVCPTTKREHWQGYIYFKEQITISAIQKYYQKNYNWQFGKLLPCKGTSEQNIIYCGGADYIKNNKMKDKNPLFKEFGKLPAQGERKDLNDLKDDILNGKSNINDIIIDAPIVYHQYGRTLDKIQDIRNSKLFRNYECKGFWYYGKTGVGKSHIAFEGYDPSTHYLLNVNDGGFWQGYEGQKTVIINEFRGQIPFSELLDICDKWPKTVKIKGSKGYPLLCNKVIITSSKHPKNIYINVLDDEESFEQLERRFEIIELFKKDSV